MEEITCTDKVRKLSRQAAQLFS